MTQNVVYKALSICARNTEKVEVHTKDVTKSVDTEEGSNVSIDFLFPQVVLFDLLIRVFSE